MSGAVETMAALNRPAAQAMQRVGVNAATDITGFGLMGHLKSMVRGSGVAAEVNLGAIPVLPGARELLDNGVAPGGTHRNLSSVEDAVTWAESLTDNDRLLLCDAQTSGGLLMSVPVGPGGCFGGCPPGRGSALRRHRRPHHRRPGGDYRRHQVAAFHPLHTLRSA